MKPAPMTVTSVLTVPDNAGYRGDGLVVAAQSESGSGAE
jgi:hypothetical protein